jgi:hypothetical protein
MSRSRLLLPVALLLPLAAACENEAVAPIDPTTPTAQVTVNAATDTQYVTFGDSVTVSSTKPTSWDLALFATDIRVNSGLGGTGTTTAYCLCVTGASTDTTVLRALERNPSSTVAAFEAVTVANIPAASEFRGQFVNPRVTGYFSGTGTSLTPTNRVFGFGLPDGSARRYAKLVVTGISNANTATNSATLVLRHTIEPTVGAGFTPGASRIDTITVGSTPVYIRFDGTAANASNFDIVFEGLTVRLGTGRLATFISGGGFDALTAADLASPAARLSPDGSASVFTSAPSAWYYYFAPLNRIFPRHELYLVRTPAGTFKVQPIGYYGPADQPRQVTLRWARLTTN